MRILLTGYKGFIGSHLLKRLEQEGHQVSTYEWGEVLPSIHEQDWVIHVGAISSTAERDVEKVMRQNVDFTVQLYNACKASGVNFQFASSASVYGLGLCFSEDAQVDPRTPYAWSKYLCERYMLMHPGNRPTQIFRYFNVYGPEGEEHKGNQASPFYQFKKQTEQTGKVKVFEGSQNYTRDFIHIDEVVNTHIKFLNVPDSGIWNVGTGTTKSFLEIAQMYSDNIQFIPMPENLKSGYQKFTCADMFKTRTTLKEVYGYKRLR